ncbi:MAG: aminopeptidase [Alphaproteobacteria bacterium]|nr:aminopeptidase [Alphaproteobacteria bacterium]
MKYKEIVNNILNNSMHGKIKGKTFRITAGTDAKELVRELNNAITDAGGFGIVNWTLAGEDSEYFINNACTQQFELTAKHMQKTLPAFDGFITIWSDNDLFAGQDLNPEKLKQYKALVMPVRDKLIIDSKPWVFMYYPSTSNAVNAQMSLKQYTEFWRQVSSLDYMKMKKSMMPLKELMEKTDSVRIVQTGTTDLSFSIKKQKAVICAGECNIPDGEVYIAPIKNSVNGFIQFNTDIEYAGIPYKNIRLEFKDGRVVRGTSEVNNDKFQKLLDSDKGARYTGEFALGVNPLITNCLKDLLFDEKINGSLHIALGKCYKDSPNGNNSQIHFDIVQIQTPEYGGGEIYFDNKLIRKDGKFIPKNLHALNKTGK